MSTPSKSNAQSKSPSTPHVKIGLTPQEWTKRGGSRAYTKRVKRMIGILSGGQPQTRGERARQSHYWLNPMFEEGNRRMRSPSERLVDKLADVQPKTSTTY